MNFRGINLHHDLHPDKNSPLDHFGTCRFQTILFGGIAWGVGRFSPLKLGLLNACCNEMK